MMGKRSHVVFIFVILLAACSSPVEEVAPESTPVPVGLTQLVVEGAALESQGGVYEFAAQVEPGDSLRVEAVVNDTAAGSITVMGKTQSYEPNANTIFLISIPDTLASADIAIVVESSDGGRHTYTLHLAAPGPGFRPGIVADLSQGAYAGQTLTTALEAKSLSGDEYDVTNVVQVVGLGDRYAGNEYVTSQELDELSWDGTQLTFLAATPGNYRLTATIADGTATREITFDVPVRWAPGQNPFPIRGVAIDTWGPPDWIDLDTVPAIIEIAADYGANYVQLAPYWNAAGTPRENTIIPCTPEAGCTTPEDEAVREWIRHAHAQNVQVLLKPHLIGGVFDRATTSYDFESWEIQPSDPEAWFTDYTDFILHYATIAEEENVEMFAVGNELNGTQLDTAHWTAVIAAVREVYDGPLTYSDPLLWQIWEGQARFWDQLDYIGIPYYYLGPNTTRPTIPEIEAEVRKVQAVNLTRAIDNYETPLIATEFGRPNFDGTSRNFVDWSNATLDNQEVTDHMEACFNTMVDLGSRFEGVFIWKLALTSATQPIDWDFRQKPLGDAIRLWFSN